MRRPITTLLVMVGFLAVSGSVAHADQLGQSATFNVDRSYDATGAGSIAATLRAVGQSAYFYVDERYWNMLSGSQQTSFTNALNQLSSDFDTTVYPRSTDLWGFEAKPGVDGDSHVYILLERLAVGTGGYFQTINGYPKNRAPESNAHEMFTVSAEGVLGGLARGFMAHEFQHLISFNQKQFGQSINDDVWINEARSEYNITNVGYNDPFSGSALQRRMQTFQRGPSDSLVEWPNTSADYAVTTIFTHYLADRLGRDVLVGTLRIAQAGIPAIDTWMQQNGQSERFPDLFTDWMVASYLNDQSVDARYGYIRDGLRTLKVVPQQTTTIGPVATSQTTYLKEWQPTWLAFNVSSTATQEAANISINGQSGPWWGGAVIATYTDGRRAVFPFSGANATVSVPRLNQAGRLTSAVLALSQGTEISADDRNFPPLSVTVSAAMGATTTSSVPAQPTPPGPISTGEVKDGDLIRHGTEKEVYVIWGKYRRYMVPGTLELYGFQNRPVISVSDDVFARYTTSNYIRAIDDQAVYSVWPDGTKHWFHITAAQWDASGRDWNSIFIINDLERDFYPTGEEITR